MKRPCNHPHNKRSFDSIDVFSDMEDNTKRNDRVFNSIDPISHKTAIVNKDVKRSFDSIDHFSDLAALERSSDINGLSKRFGTIRHYSDSNEIKRRFKGRSNAAAGDHRNVAQLSDADNFDAMFDLILGTYDFKPAGAAAAAAEAIETLDLSRRPSESDAIMHYNDGKSRARRRSSKRASIGLCQFGDTTLSTHEMAFYCYTCM